MGGVRSIDTGTYEPLLEEALGAYRHDDGLCVEIVTAAVSIQRKRDVWAARSELRVAETAAQVECRAAGVVVCAVQSPCGTGECPFATGDMARLEIRAPGVKMKRPAERPTMAHWPAYTIEDAVQELYRVRSGQKVG